MKIIFSESSNLNNSIYGNCQAPIKMFLEKRGEEFEQRTMSGEPYLNDTLSPSMMPKDDRRITTINPIVRKTFLNLTN